MCKRSQVFGCSWGDWLNKWLAAELLATKHMTDVSVPFTHANLSPSLCKHLQLLCWHVVSQESASYAAEPLLSQSSCEPEMSSSGGSEQSGHKLRLQGDLKYCFTQWQLNTITTITLWGLVTHTQRPLTCRKLMEVLFFLSKDTVSLLNVSSETMW